MTNPHIQGFRILKSFIIAALFTGIVFGCSAQLSASEERFSPQAAGYMERARTMSEAGNYTGAIDQLRHIQTERISLSSQMQEEFQYLLADAFYNRGDKECIQMLRTFKSDFPASTHALDASLKIGNYFFFRHQWPEALQEYETIDTNRLNRELKPLYSYRTALCQIKTGHFAEARKSLQALAHANGFHEAYLFYSAYLDYIDGNYDKAYNLFAKVTSPERGLQAGYYMTQIDFTRGKFKEVAERGEKLLRQEIDPELAPELNRITGLALFKSGYISKAKTYLGHYLEICPGTPAPDAVYSLGVCDYEEGNFTQAAERFASLTELNDELGQSAWLFLGQCDVKDGNDDAAAMAFEKAARMDFDRNVSETALYNYVAALTRGGNVPFSSSADMLEGFTKLYPNSDYTQKVEAYLAKAYYNDRNYAKALENIEKIKRPSADILTAKQKVLYQLGVEAMANGKIQDATNLFARSLQLASHDPKLALQTQLWYGDALYATGNFSKAENAYNAFIKGEGRSSNRTLALYNLAYSLYQQDKYQQSSQAFRNAIDASPKLPSPLLTDANVRLGDCLYYTGAYKEAKNSYAKAISAEATDADYASYRHAVMLGLEGDTNGKINELSQLSSKYPDSKWIPNALMEKALTFESLDRHTEAAEAFNQLADAYPRTMQARKAMLNLALTYSKAGNMLQACDTYKDIIRTWPSSEEAELANADLKKHYATTGALTDYAAFLRSVPEAKQLNADEMEQLAFDGAETAFAENPDNISLLQNYVREYPDGKYLSQALLDIATTLRLNSKYSEAEETLAQLIAKRPHSAQYNEALLAQAEILENNLPGRKSEAFSKYQELGNSADPDFTAEAYAGMARTSDNPSVMLENARKARNSGGISGEEADKLQLIEAEALLLSDNRKESLQLLGTLSHNPNSEAGAKAAVRLAELYLEDKDYSRAEKLMLNFTEQGTPHQYQLAKGFILLADAYHGLKKNSLAREYLISLKDNYPGNEPEIRNAIESRLKSYK